MTNPALENPTVAAPRNFHFDEFSFDAADKVLYKDGEIIQFAPKACELLGVFVANAGKLINKDELMNQVWNDSFVEEGNLTHHISALRKALGEDKNGRKFIETIPRKGYRFVAPVNEANNSAAEITISERMTAHALRCLGILRATTCRVGRRTASVSWLAESMKPAVSAFMN